MCKIAAEAREKLEADSKARAAEFKDKAEKKQPKRPLIEELN